MHCLTFIALHVGLEKSAGEIPSENIAFCRLGFLALLRLGLVSRATKIQILIKLLTQLIKTIH
jgi:hypothetical protein